MIELRSDTFTRPPRSMRAAMASADVGDDVYGEDPTVKELERLAADLLGKEAGCLLPSGTMANLAILLAHAPRGTTAVVGAESDIYLYQAHGASVVGGIGLQPVPNRPDGTLDPVALTEAFPEDPDDPQFALPAVICLEDTQNRCGGAVLPAANAGEVAALAATHGVGVHLDGARIFNAAVASGRPVAELAAHADTVQFCLSKGLRAPIGSMAVGSARLIAGVRRARKMLGGGMRQAGIVAAAGIVALEEMVERLADDHVLAVRLADGLSSLPGLVVDPAPMTNIVLFRLPAGWTVDGFLAAAASAGVALYGFGHGRVRAVTHADVSAEDVDAAVDVLGKVVNGRPA